jgi:hypothetical protein
VRGRRFDPFTAKFEDGGHGAPEKPFGADGIFQIDIEDGAGIKVWQKGLPF